MIFLKQLPSSRALRVALIHGLLLVTSLAACNRHTERSARRHGPPDVSEEEERMNILHAEVDEWMNQPYQNSSNIPRNLREVVFALNGSQVSPSNPDRVFLGQNSQCSACRLLAKFVIGYLRSGGPAVFMTQLIVAICYLVFYRNKEVCNGIINQEKENLEYILKHSHVTGNQLCALVMSIQVLHGDCGLYRGQRWSVVLPAPSLAYASTHGGTARQLHSVYRDQVMEDTRHLVNNNIATATSLRADDFSFKNTSFGSKLPYNLLSSSKYPTSPHERSLSVTFFHNLRNKYQFRDPLFNEGRPYLKVLHLTDLHFDPHYKAGSRAVCEAPLCCTDQSGPARHPKEAAGKWGDYRDCDSPRILIETMMQHIRDHHPDIDYIMWTGDSVPHDLWRITRRGNSAIISEVASMIHKHFPGVPLYGSIGNHESFPRDSFPPPEIPSVWKRFGVQWLYDTIATQWQTFVPNTPLPASARISGCYAMTVRPGFKIISINSNYCYKLNWWTLYKNVDPGHVLRWLIAELLTAEASGDYVHIIGHIAPLYSDCYEEWSHQFSRIVTRFSHVIRGQFYGHCHRDDVRVHFDVRNPDLPIGVQYLTPNNGPYKGLNPSFRLYYVDGDHKETKRSVIDFETYFLNLTQANMYDNAHWQLLYRARRDLGLQALEPKDWDNLAHRMARDEALASKYYRYNVQASDHLLQQGCDAGCRHSLICNIVEGDKFMPKKCRSRR